MTSWMPKRLKEIEAAYNASVANLKAAQGELAKHVEETRRQFEGLTREQEEQLAEHYRSGKAGKEMRELQLMVDREEITWDDVRAGRVDPPQLADAYWRNQEKLGRLLQAAGEGRNLDDFLDEEREAGYFYSAKRAREQRGW